MGLETSWDLSLTFLCVFSSVKWNVDFSLLSVLSSDRNSEENSRKSRRVLCHFLLRQLCLFLLFYTRARLLHCECEYRIVITILLRILALPAHLYGIKFVVIRVIIKQIPIIFSPSSYFYCISPNYLMKTKVSHSHKCAWVNRTLV